MSDGYPSLTALLGLLAVAGYQNRDKIGAWLSHATQANAGAAPATVPPVPNGPAGGGLLDGLGNVLGRLGGGSPPSTGGFLGGALGELVDRFRQNGQESVANSWVTTGPNRDVSPQQLEQAIGPDVIGTLLQHTGLTKDELLSRLANRLPDAVDRYTPDGRLPA